LSARNAIFWATIFGAFSGCETGSFMGEEIEEPRKTIPRALLVSGVALALAYVLGTAALLVTLPAGQISGVDGFMQGTAVLCERLGLVPQKPYLFSGTVASNLRYGKPDATEEELWEALEVAQAKDFVSAMEGGLDAKIEQGGVNVSGGQRQRLAIARALVRKPEIYLFDDSFSALDLATDARLRAALKPYTRSSTVLIVAQRVSTIADADQIVVLEDGQVVGRGTHGELLASCPTYVEIVASQEAEQGAAALAPRAIPVRPRRAWSDNRSTSGVARGWAATSRSPWRGRRTSRGRCAGSCPTWVPTARSSWWCWRWRS